MFEQTIETSATPHITVVECLGNLVARGSEEKQVTVNARGGAGEVTMEQEGETFTIETREDCFLTCPPGSTLTVRTVRGNLKIEGVQGPVAIGDVHGNTSLRAVGHSALEQAFGNLSGRQAAGDLSVQTARGNVQIRQVEGDLSLSQVDGNLAVEGVSGDLTADHVRGNIRLGPPFSPGAVHQLNAGGNLTIYLPSDASLRLALQAGGSVRSSVPGLELEEGETQAILGAGEASLEARVGGQIRLHPSRPEDGPRRDFAFDSIADLEGLGAQIEASIAEAMAELETRLGGSLGYLDSEKVQRRIERTTEKARLKAEKEVEKARRKVEHETEKAHLRAERAERRWRRASGQRSRPRAESMSDEERMRVLRLVEDGKISPEQAASLLAAMEGR